MNFHLLKLQTTWRRTIQWLHYEWVRYFKSGDARAQALAENIALSILDSTPDLFMLKSGKWLLRWKIMETDQVLSFALRGFMQNRLTECDPDAQQLFERIAKCEYPSRLLVQLLYTKRVLDDHRFMWIRQTDVEWGKLVQAARDEPNKTLITQSI